jgi:hypothetical protein
MAARDPLWARWRVRAVPVQPWARVGLDGRDGPIPARLLSIGRGWVSVEVDTPQGARCEVWPPELVRWSEARLLPECSGVSVEVGGRVHRCGLEAGEARVWAWVRRAVEVGGTVEGLRVVH